MPKGRSGASSKGALLDAYLGNSALAAATVQEASGDRAAEKPTARLSACFIELPGFSQDEKYPGRGVSKVQKSNSSCEKRELFAVRSSLFHG